MATRPYPDGSSRSRSRVPAASAPRRSRHAARTGRPGRPAGPDDVYVAGATSGARRRTTAPCPRTIGPGAISPSRRSFRPESEAVAFGSGSPSAGIPAHRPPLSPSLRRRRRPERAVTIKIVPSTTPYTRAPEAPTAPNSIRKIVAPPTAPAATGCSVAHLRVRIRGAGRSRGSPPGPRSPGD